MRKTLDELKAIDRQELGAHWAAGRWPFDLLQGCSFCQTHHALFPSCSVTEHKALRCVLPAMNSDMNTEDYLSANLEALYAAREFFPFWAEEPQLEPAIAATDTVTAEVTKGNSQ